MRQTLARLVWISALLSPVFVIPAADAAQTGARGPESRQPYYGDLHLHTGFSFDAWSSMGTRTTPDEAYRFARGEMVNYQGKMVRRQDPLDFLAVTDHAEYIGVLNQLEVPQSSFAQSDLGKSFLADRQSLFANIFAMVFEYRPAPPAMNAAPAMREAWQKEVEAANANYRPGKFTTFVGYEWTAQITSGAYNLHRNVIFRDAAPQLPFSSVDSQRPEDLWTYLENLRKQGVEALAIPHNANGSGGLMYDWVTSDGRAIDQREVVRRVAVDVHDEEPVLATRDGGHLDARPSERGQRLVQFELAAGEGTGEHLQLGLLDRRLAVDAFAHAARGYVR